MGTYRAACGEVVVYSVGGARSDVCPGNGSISAYHVCPVGVGTQTKPHVLVLSVGKRGEGREGGQWMRGRRERGGTRGGGGGKGRG